MPSRHGRRVCGGLLLLFLIALSAGCGPNYKARGAVKGKVSFAGKSLTAGTVMFYGQQGNMTGSGAITPDGSYFVPDAPLGEVKITVSVPPVPFGGLKHLKGAPTGPVMPGSTAPADLGKIPSQVIPIPEKYAKVETTPLTFSVKRGEQTHDIDLKP